MPKEPRVSRRGRKKSVNTKTVDSGKRKRKQKDEEEEENEEEETVEITIEEEESDQEEKEPSDSEDDIVYKDDEEKDPDFTPKTKKTKTTSSDGTTKRGRGRPKKSTSSASTTTTTTSTSKPKKTKTGTSGTTTRKSTKKSTTSGSGSTTTKGKRGRKKGSTTKSTTKKREIEEDLVVENEDKDSLFSIVRQENASIKETIDEWQERFEKDKIKTGAELIKFMMHSCGANGKKLEFNEDKLEEKDDKKISKQIDKLIKFIPKKVQTYPIISNHPSLKYFSKNFEEFWSVFVDITKESQLTDDVMLKVLQWFIVMTSSTCRAVRHTSTLALYQIATSVIDAIKSEKKTLSKLEKKAKAAKKNKEKKQEKEYINQCEEYQDKINLLEKILSDIYNSVFILRYRDAFEGIRALSLLKAGNWVLNFPDKYLNDQTIKYFGWMINDTDEMVRKTAIGVLEKFYNQKDWKDQLSSFTKKFMSRYISLTRDKDVSVAVEAIKLLSVLLKNNYITDKKDIETICSLVFDENASIRFFAGKFLFKHLKDKAKKKKTKKKKQLELSDILEFLSENSENFPMASYYVVDTLWNSTEVFREYKEICTLILEEESDSLVTIKLLNASIKKLKGSLTSVTSADDNVKVSNKSKLTTKEVDDELADVTDALAPSLSEMIDKYCTEPEKVVELVEIPTLLPLDKFTSHRKSFKDLLKSLKEAFWKNVNINVFTQIAKTFKYLVVEHEEYELQSEAQTSYDELVRELSTKLKDAVQTLQNEEPTSDVLTTLQRIESFSRTIGTSQFIDADVLINDIISILDSKIAEVELLSESEQNSDEVTPILLSILFYDIYWTFMKANKPNNETDDSTKSFIIKRNKLVDRCIELLQEGKNYSNITRSAFSLLCNLFIMCNPKICIDKRFVINLMDEKVEKIRQYFGNSMEKLKINPSARDEDDSDEEEEQVEIRKKQEQDRKNQLTDLLLCSSRSVIISTFSDKIIPDILSYFIRTKISIVEEIIKKIHHELKLYNPDQLWDYEFEALRKLHNIYLEKIENDEKRKVREKAYKEFEDLAARLSRSHFPGKDYKHIDTLVTQTINYVFDDLNQYHTFLIGILKFNVKNLPENNRKQYETTIKEKKEQLEEREYEISEDAQGSIKKFIDSLNLKKKKEKTDESEKESEDEENNKKKRKKDERDEEEEEKEGTDIEEDIEVDIEVNENKKRKQEEKEPSQKEDEEEEEDSNTKKRKKEEEEKEEDNDDTQISDAPKTQSDDEEEDEDIIVNEPKTKKQKDL
ncbi:hypothetical protein ABK040_006273 [Willaertia magna]